VSLAPEVELLIRAARLRAGAQAIRELAQRTRDWPLVQEMAAHHGLRPLLFRHLDAFAADVVPREVFTAMWVCSERLAARNRRMTQELVRLIAALESAGIPALPYKGPALAQSLYGDVALREFADLDLLLRARDVPRAHELLEALGYLPEHPLAPQARAAVLASTSQYHLALMHQGGDIMVEIHWKTDARAPVEASLQPAWWHRAPDALLADVSVRSFAPSERLLVLCIHGSKHHWASIGWLVDVAELLRREPRFDAEWMLAAARRFGSERKLALGLRLARDLLDAPLPERLESLVISHPELDGIAARILQLALDPHARAVGVFERLKLDLSLLDRMGDRLGHAFDVVFAPTLEERNSQELRLAHYPRRLVRLLRKHAPAGDHFGGHK
jgi:hypothetical protein